ncbi:hypothetical protein [Bacillus nitratireducens]|uniref:hypothetical protein n=1 Tax=Bacillus nitratireducens TaxID=2026193 RepID=UPI0011A032BD|nr:hypothetical protein [Bacillus nitratireducens]
MTNANLNNFLNSNVGKRMMAMAKAEEKAFQDGIAGIQSQIDIVKQDMNFNRRGISPNVTKLVSLDGNLALVTSGAHSQVTDVQVITNDNFKDLDASIVGAIKQSHGVAFQKLKHNSYELNTSNRYFELLDTAEKGSDIDVLTQLAEAPQSDNPYKAGFDKEAWKHYETAEDRASLVPKGVRMHQKNRSEETYKELSQKLFSLEDQLQASINSNEITPYVEAVNGISSEGDSAE